VESDEMDRVLVIDDEPGISELICEVLGRIGYTVEIADNGTDGLRWLASADFDLVVTDMCMPDVSGDFIVRHIRNSDRSITPVIGISGTPWLLEGVDFDAVLPKPFSLQTLADTVKKIKKKGDCTVH
jgi:CheY-like chemotaxis protein